MTDGRRHERQLRRMLIVTLKSLDQALGEIQMELNANSPDEINTNPMLKGKQQFVNRKHRQLANIYTFLSKKP